MNPEYKNTFRSKAARSAGSECAYRLKGLIHEFGQRAADGAGRVGFATSRARAEVLLQAFRALHDLGFEIRRPQNLGNRHVKALVAHWESQALSASTMQKRFSIVRVFCGWIGKKGMVGELESYVSNPEVVRRTYVATRDKSWTAQQVDIRAKIEEVFTHDAHVGVQLLLQWAFMLRAKEAWLLQPRLADQGAVLAVNWGTKGGRDRVVPIRAAWQRTILEFAKGYANDANGSLIPASRTLENWKCRFYRVCRRCGIAQESGLVPHGLRHQGANDLYEQLTGAPSPVREGASAEVGAWLDRLARSVVAETLGHSRTQIVSAYCGRQVVTEKAQ